MIQQQAKRGKDLVSLYWPSSIIVQLSCFSWISNYESREKKSSRDQWPAVPHFAYTRFILFPFSSIFLFRISESPCSYLFFLLFLFITSFHRYRAGETKSDSYDSSKMQLDVLRLLLEAEGVVNDNNIRKGKDWGGKGRMRKKANQVYKRNSQVSPSPLVSFYRTCYLINVVLNFILYNNNNN